jgi:hypothetical protein
MDTRLVAARDVLGAAPEVTVIEERARALRVEALGERVTVALVGEHAIEVVAALCEEGDLDAHQAVRLSATLSFGAIVLVDAIYYVRQVLPLAAFASGAIVPFVNGAARTARRVRARIGGRVPEIALDPMFSAYAG